MYKLNKKMLVKRLLNPQVNLARVTVKMNEIIFTPRAYCKMIMHSAKYPHCAINGILLTKETDMVGEKQKTLVYVDVIPLFHLCLNVTPMAEIALSQIALLAESAGLVIAGYYVANENMNDMSIEKPSLRIADKISEKCRQASVILIDNKLVTLEHAEPAICCFYNCDGKWKQLDKNKLTVSDDILDQTSSLLVRKVYYDLVDFDNHMDDITLDWKNTALNSQIERGMYDDDDNDDDENP